MFSQLHSTRLCCSFVHFSQNFNSLYFIKNTRESWSNFSEIKFVKIRLKWWRRWEKNTFAVFFCLIIAFCNLYSWKLENGKINFPLKKEEEGIFLMENWTELCCEKNRRRKLLIKLIDKLLKCRNNEHILLSLFDGLFFLFKHSVELEGKKRRNFQFNSFFFCFILFLSLSLIDIPNFKLFPLFTSSLERLKCNVKLQKRKEFN